MKNAVFYQVYPSSFQDSDGNGIGDIKGIESRFDYIKSTGVNAAWLNPVFRSASRNGNEQKVSVSFFLTLPGVPFIYCGDEIGMKYIPKSPDVEGSFPVQAAVPRCNGMRVKMPVPQQLLPVSFINPDILPFLQTHGNLLYETFIFSKSDMKKTVKPVTFFHAVMKVE